MTSADRNSNTQGNVYADLLTGPWASVVVVVCDASAALVCRFGSIIMELWAFLVLKLQHTGPG